MGMSVALRLSQHRGSRHGILPKSSRQTGRTPRVAQRVPQSRCSPQDLSPTAGPAARSRKGAAACRIPAPGAGGNRPCVRREPGALAPAFSGGRPFSPHATGSPTGTPGGPGENADHRRIRGSPCKAIRLRRWIVPAPGPSPSLRTAPRHPPERPARLVAV